MNWYDIFKFLHVASAVCWVGGGVILMYLGARAGRANDTDAQMTVIKQTASLARGWFMPAALSTVIFGLIVATLGNLWSNAWVILGLVEVLAVGYLPNGSQYRDGIAFVILIAILLVKPSGLLGKNVAEKV